MLIRILYLKIFESIEMRSANITLLAKIIKLCGMTKFKDDIVNILSKPPIDNDNIQNQFMFALAP